MTPRRKKMMGDFYSAREVHGAFQRASTKGYSTTPPNAGKIYEDDPRFDPKTMGNKRKGRRRGTRKFHLSDSPSSYRAVPKDVYERRA